MPTYDGRGNMTNAGGTAYTYDSRNKLTAFGFNTLHYDATGRLARLASPDTRFMYDGDRLIAETSATGAILRRYIHGPGTDEVIAWYEGAGTADRRYLKRDERGSATLVSGASRNVLGVNAYDVYGIPKTANLGRFQYTGQTWIPELGMYYYKARIYSATMGRFMQTDPIGYKDGMNWYNYAGSDPVNRADPSGLCSVDGCITVQARGGLTFFTNYYSSADYEPYDPYNPPSGGESLDSGDLQQNGDGGEIVVTGRRPAPRPAAPPITVTVSPFPSGITMIAANDNGKKTGRRGPISRCPGLGQECGAPNGGGAHPGYPGVCYDCLRKGGKWPPPDSWRNTVIIVGGVVILGGIILAPQVTIPALIFGGAVSN